MPGCGTLHNLHAIDGTRPVVYGGVRSHLHQLEGIGEFTKNESSDLSKKLAESTFEIPITLGFAALTTVDLAASVVGDTVTIPLVLAKQQEWDSAPAEVRDKKAEAGYPALVDRVNGFLGRLMVWQ